MKIRTGFVSNSSTSSFVIVGYKVDFNNLQTKQQKLDFINKYIPTYLQKEYEKTDIDKKSEVDDLFIEVLRDGHFGEEFDAHYLEDMFIVGKFLSCAGSEDGLCEEKFDMQDLLTKCDNAKKEFNLSGDPKIYSLVSYS